MIPRHSKTEREARHTRAQTRPPPPAIPTPCPESAPVFSPPRHGVRHWSRLSPDRMLRDHGSRSGGGRSIRSARSRTVPAGGIEDRHPGAACPPTTRRRKQTAMPVPVTPLTRVSARQARKLRWSHGLSISGQDGFGGAGRQTLTNRPQRMIVICPGNHPAPGRHRVRHRRGAARACRTRLFAIG